MSQYQMNTREGHLEVLCLIFHFLWKNPKKRQMMDPSPKIIDESVFYYNVNWVEFYVDVTEEDLTRTPEPLSESL